MVLRMQSVSFDSRDPAATARFWEAALGWRITEEDRDEVVLEPPVGGPGAPDLVFVRVPDPKSVKNRVHLDLRPDDQHAEVTRLEGLGAARTGTSHDSTWVVMADPEGNEFCVLRPLA